MRRDDIDIRFERNLEVLWRILIVIFASFGHFACFVSLFLLDGELFFERFDAFLDACLVQILVFALFLFDLNQACFDDSFCLSQSLGLSLSDSHL